MNDPRTDKSTLIVGLGSPHGDDQLGWWIIENLERHPHLPANTLAIHEPTQLVHRLDRWDRLIIVDACRTGAAAGTVTRLSWPDPRIQGQHSHSTHSMSVWTALRLAECVGHLPTVIDIFGVEIGHCETGRQPSQEVLSALPKVEELILHEVCETTHA